jgi:hypothetical protein
MMRVIVLIALFLASPAFAEPASVALKAQWAPCMPHLLITLGHRSPSEGPRVAAFPPEHSQCEAVLKDWEQSDEGKAGKVK